MGPGGAQRGGQYIAFGFADDKAMRLIGNILPRSGPEGPKGTLFSRAQRAKLAALWAYIADDSHVVVVSCVAGRKAESNILPKGGKADETRFSV